MALRQLVLNRGIAEGMATHAFRIWPAVALVLSLGAANAMAANYRIDLHLEHLPPEIKRAEVTLTYSPSFLYPWARVAAAVDEVVRNRQIGNHVETSEVPIVDGRILLDLPRSRLDGAGSWQLDDIDVSYGPFKFELQPKDYRSHFTSERPHWTLDGKTLVFDGPAYLFGRERQMLPREFSGLRATLDHRPFSWMKVPWRNDDALLAEWKWRPEGDGFRHPSGAELSWYSEAGILRLATGRVVELPLLSSVPAADAIEVDEPTLEAFLLAHHPAYAEKAGSAASEENRRVLSRILFNELLISPEEWASLVAKGSRAGLTLRPVKAAQIPAEPDPRGLRPLVLALDGNRVAAGHYVIAASPQSPYFGIVILRIDQASH